MFQSRQNTQIFFKLILCVRDTREHIKMNKKLKVTLTILNNIPLKYSEKKDDIEQNLMEVWKGESLTKK